MLSSPYALIAYMPYPRTIHPSIHTPTHAHPNTHSHPHPHPYHRSSTTSACGWRAASSSTPHPVPSSPIHPPHRHLSTPTRPNYPHNPMRTTGLRPSWRAARARRHHPRACGLWQDDGRGGGQDRIWCASYYLPLYSTLYSLILYSNSILYILILYSMLELYTPYSTLYTLFSNSIL